MTQSKFGSLTILIETKNVGLMYHVFEELSVLSEELEDNAF
jgi:hypothetical protein